MKLSLILFSALFFYIQILIPQVKDNSYMLYDDSQVTVINIKMDPAAYNYMLGHPHEDSLQLCTMHFKNAVIDDSIDNAGIRIRGNTSRDSRKLSFKISFDDYDPGREFYGIEEMNLNGEHNDPSISRAKICWDIFKETGVIASRAAHAAVYINDIYHGLYISVEHLDKNFLKRNFGNPSGNLWKCLYPADLTYKGSSPSSYFYSESFPAYELVTNKAANDYSSLARLINIINNTSSASFADSIEAILAVPDFLKYEALNIILGSWDEYWSLMNNYYLYFDPSVMKFRWMPYDYDNTMGIDWSGTDWTKANPYSYPQVVRGSRPLFTNLMKMPEYRNLFTHFLEFYNNNVVTPGKMNPVVDELKNKITPYAENDMFRTLDYGFTFVDFLNSFDKLQHDHVKKGIKEFILQRNASLNTQLNYIPVKPMIYNVTSEYTRDSVIIYVSAFDNKGIKSLTLNAAGGQSYVMHFSPLPGSKVEDADRWAGSIPRENITSDTDIKIEAVNNLDLSVNKTYTIKYAAPLQGIVINEILADNAGSSPDPAGENDDWIELFNSSSESVNLTGMYLTDKIDNKTKWQFTQPGLILDPGEYIVVWCDEDDSTDQEGLHANFKLSKGGEFIGLVYSDSTTWIDSITFDNQATDISFSRLPDGFNSWAFTSPTPGRGNKLTYVSENKIPSGFEVSAYPNPFNPATNIYYVLPNTTDVQIKIYDIMGNEIWSHSRENVQPGRYTVEWNAHESNGAVVSSGIYFCRVKAGKFSKVQKIMLMK